MARVSVQQLARLNRIDLPASRVSVEPGGQIEISTAPANDLDTALDALAADTAALDYELAELGLLAHDRPVDLLREPQRILNVPRYRAMEEYFDAAGGAGRWMMCNTAALQVNLSHDPDGSSRRWRVLHAIAPLLIATFANSPAVDRLGRFWASLRQGIWYALDRRRTLAPNLDEPAAAAWADYALAADVMLIRAADDVVGLRPGLPFADWLRAGHPAGWPTADDLRYHLTTLFPPVRPRGWLELRVIDALPSAVVPVAVLTVGAAVQEQVADELLRRLPDTAAWWLDAARYGLAHDRLAAASDILFEITSGGLPLVTGRPDRITAVAEYRSACVDRRVQPWGGSIADPRDPGAPTRTRREACGASRSRSPALPA